MKRPVILVASVILFAPLLLVAPLVSVPAVAQPAAQAPPPPATDTVAPAIPGVTAAGTKVTVIKEGFQGTEGPIALPDGSVVFTETNASRLTRIDKDNNVSTFLENTNGSNGLAFDAKGRMISVQTTPGQTRVGVIYPKGSEVTFEGTIDGRPNDLTVNRQGGVYFTVPGPVAQPAGAPAPATPFVPFVYYIPPGGRAVKAAEGIDNPNGILLSRDEKTIYINNTRGEYLLAYDVQADGRAGQPPQLRPLRGCHEGCDRRDEWSRWPRYRQRGSRVCRDLGGCPGLQSGWEAPRDDSRVALTAEHRVRRPRQEDALHRRPRRRVESADAHVRFSGTGEVAMARDRPENARKKWVAVTAVVAWLMLGRVGAVAACSCAPSSSPCQAIGSQAVVFLGTAESVEPAGSQSGGPAVRWRFTVREVINGALGDARTVSVTTAADGAACGFPFEVGLNYLVYAYAARSGADLGVLSTGLCSRTGVEQERQTDFALLRETRAGTVRSRLVGVVERLTVVVDGGHVQNRPGWGGAVRDDCRHRCLRNPAREQHGRARAVRVRRPRTGPVPRRANGARGLRVHVSTQGRG